MRRIPQLDGLRGVAILAVIAGHFAEFHLLSTRFLLAPAGVSIFFALSGYLICSLLIGEKSRTGTIQMKRFYWRRMLRLWPALLAMLFVLAAVHPWLPPGDMPLATWLLAVFYLRDIAGRGLATGHLWSLALEEQFYLIWPWVLNRVKIRPLIYGTVAVILAMSTLRTTMGYLYPHMVTHGDIYVHPWYRADTILSGCLIALLIHEAKATKEANAANRTNPLIRLVEIVPVAVWMALLVAAGLLPDGGPYLALSLAICFFLVFGCLLRERDIAVRALSARWLGVIGDYSYSIYLWQQLLFVVKFRPPLQFLANWPWNILVLAALAIASRQLIEKPFLRLRDRKSAEIPIENPAIVR